MPVENIISRMTSGNDLFTGVHGVNVLHWTPGGTDTFHAGDGGENFDANPYSPGNPGGDRLFLTGDRGAFVQMTDWNDGTAKIGNSILTFTGVERIHGTEGNDTVRAGGATSPNGAQGISVFTGGGNDNIVGSAYDDVIDGGAGNDTIWAGNGNDFIHSSTGNDLIYGGAGNENIRWGGGNTRDHNPGNDTIHGGEGTDLINVWVYEEWNGGKGAHTTITTIREKDGFAGVSVVGTDDHGGKATLRFQGFEQGWNHNGNDTLDASGAAVVGTAGVQWNTRWGNDRLIGSRGNDTLEGGEGRDTIEGGAGNDLISANGDFYNLRAPGDGDVDTLIFNRGFGHDTVLGFDTGIDILQFGAGITYSAAEVRGGTLLTCNTGDTVLLSNVYDFI